MNSTFETKKKSFLLDASHPVVYTVVHIDFKHRSFALCTTSGRGGRGHLMLCVCFSPAKCAITQCTSQCTTCTTKITAITIRITIMRLSILASNSCGTTIDDGESSPFLRLWHCSESAVQGACIHGKNIIRLFLSSLRRRRRYNDPSA